MARAMHEPLLFYHSIVFSGCIQLSLYMYANSCSIEAFLLHLAYLSSEFKVEATYIHKYSQVGFIFRYFRFFYRITCCVIFCEYPHPGGCLFVCFFIEQPHNTGTIARTANNIFSYVSPLSISLCYLLLHILMRKQGRESRASLLEFSTQMAQNSERVEISGAAC